MNDVNDETCSIKNASANGNKENVAIYDAIHMMTWHKIVEGKINQDKCKCFHSTTLEVIIFCWIHKGVENLIN